MKNKNYGVKLCLFALIAGGFSLSATSALNLSVDLSSAGMYTTNSKSNSPVHFADNGNDFGGFIHITSNDSEDPCSSDDTDCELSEASWPYSVEVNGDKYDCKRQVKGFYYNSERGERLWPLDAESFSGIQEDLTTTGGIYTMCVRDRAAYSGAIAECLEKAEVEEGEDVGGGGEPEVPTDPVDVTECINEVKKEYMDELGYYGSVTHEYGDRTFTLAAGVTYQTGVWITMSGDSKLSPTFQRFGGTKPVGFVYDYNGGVGFVGCLLNDSDANGRKASLNKMVELTQNGSGIAEFFDMSGDVLVRSGGNNVHLDCKNVGGAGNLLGLLIEGLVGLTTKTQENLQGSAGSEKMQYFQSVNINNATLINYTKQRAESLCRGKWLSSEPANYSGSIVCLSGVSVNAYETKYEGKTLIVKNGKVTVKPATNQDDTIYDIFVNSGNLIIDEEDAKKFVFNSQGFVSSENVENFNNTAMCVLGINEDEECDDSLNGDAAVAVLLRGNFIVNGYIKGINGEQGTLSNKYFIHGKLTSKDSIESLENTFQWECEFGISNNNTDYCLDNRRTNSSYSNSALIIIDQTYDSPLYR